MTRKNSLTLNLADGMKKNLSDPNFQNSFQAPEFRKVASAPTENQSVRQDIFGALLRLSEKFETAGLNKSAEATLTLLSAIDQEIENSKNYDPQELFITVTEGQ